MPVNPYGDFLNNISGIDNITADYKNKAGVSRNLSAGQKAIADAKSMAAQYNSASTGITIGKPKTVSGGAPIPFGMPGAGGGSSGGGGFNAFMRAIKEQESGGRYGVRGIPTKGGRALGAYQIMSYNLPSWSRQVLGRSVSANQFLKSPQLQDKIAGGILKGYYDKWGAGGAAAAWYGGPGAGKKYAAGVRNRRKQYGGPSIADYVSKVLSRM